MREAGISTDDVSQFVRDLSKTDVSWEALENGVIALAAPAIAAFDSVDIGKESLINDLIHKILMLPTSFCLPVTFANPDDPHVLYVLKHLKDFAKPLGPICSSHYSTDLKILVIRCYIHLYQIACGVPLGIGLMFAVAILRMTADAIVAVMNTCPMTSTQLRELSVILDFKSPSFEQMLIGEIGLINLTEAFKLNDEAVENWRIETQINPSLKSEFIRVKVRKRVPMLEPMIHDGTLKKFLNCLREYRTKGDKIGIKDYKKTMENSSFSSRVAHYFQGNMSSSVFRNAFLFQAKPELISIWMRDTIAVALGDQRLASDDKWEWGFTSITKSGNQVHSHLFLTSYFGNQLEYVVRLSPQSE